MAQDVELRRGKAPEWPDDLLDVGALIAAGTQPLPLRQFLLKVHSRCNLACDYCYIYTMADQGWRTMPRQMPAAIVDLAAARIAEHVRRHGLDRVQVILHGGEPLLAGIEAIAYLAARMREAVAGAAAVDLSIQSNGVLLRHDAVRALARLDIRIGVSLDGEPAAHDRHRRYTSGAGSHAQTAEALRVLGRPEYQHVYGGILCTIDLSSDPVATYEALLRFSPPAIDLLLPHGNWSARPPGRPAEPALTPYADWLIRVFDRWYGAARYETRIRLFEEIIGLLFGGAAGTEAVGLGPSRLVVIETDGSLKASDALTPAYHGAGRLEMHLASHDFDAAMRHPAIFARQLGAAALSATCKVCRLRTVCGGGNYAHRYRAGSGFRHPSVYCPDLYRLIGHIRAKVAADVARSRSRQALT
jgi:uncharacterized protein